MSRLPAANSHEFERTWDAIERFGIVLLADPVLPSVATIVAGETIRGSWWGHPRGREIYAVATALDSHPEVVAAKLVSGKITYVHRRLWPALLAVARSSEPWQVERLSLPTRGILSAIRRAGSLRAEDLPGSPTLRKKAVRDLEARLLVHVDEIHAEQGSHSKILETWDHWAARSRAPKKRMTSERGRESLDAAVHGLQGERGASGTLPWWPS